MTGEGTGDKGLADNDPALERTDLSVKGSIGSPSTFLTVLLQFDQKFRIAHYFKKFLFYYPYTYIGGR